MAGFVNGADAGVGEHFLLCWVSSCGGLTSIRDDEAALSNDKQIDGDWDQPRNWNPNRPTTERNATWQPRHPARHLRQFLP